jgi:tungstate transport system substrate-binding protein
MRGGLHTLAIAGVLLAGACSRATPPALVLATTTSVGNSGLLDTFLPAFTAETGVDVRVHLVGSGLAIGMLESGQADAVISHAPAREARALQGHQGWYYRKILHNDFVLVGPADDPAGAASASTIGEAMGRVAAGGSWFISRGDESGTHEREVALWRLAGVAPDAAFIVVAGQGMGATLRGAGETGSYTLTDRGTFSALERQVSLRIVFEGGAELVNTYAVMAPGDNVPGARFAGWLAEGAGRDRLRQVLDAGTIRNFTLWPAGRPATTPDALPF